MKLVDHSPPAQPTLDQQKDALQKGLGRALRWAREGRLDDDALLAACLTDQRYDRQCEERRTDWVWELIEAQNAVDRFRVPILYALHPVRDDASVWQLGELAEHYAAAGDDLFRERLYEVVEQDADPDGSSFAEKPIVRLDGLKGFLFAAAARGRRLLSREWDWPEDSFLAFAEKQLGKEVVQAALESSRDEGVCRLREAMRPMPVDTPSARTSWQTRVATIPAEEVLRKAEIDRSVNDFIGWRRVAPAAELQKVVDRLWTIEDPVTLACLLRLFMMQGLPNFDERLIGLCLHTDETVSRRAFQVLRHHSDPRIRDFAMSEMHGNLDRDQISLLINNYVPDIQRLVLESLEMPEDACDRHHLLFDFAKLFEKNPEADPVPIGTIVYAMTPCSNCRQNIVKVLTKRGLAPTWMLEECRLDCDRDIRKLVLDGPAP